MGPTRIKTIVDGKINTRLLTPTNQAYEQKIYGKTGKTREGLANFVGYKYYKEKVLYIGLFECREAERWILVRKIIK